MARFWNRDRGPLDLEAELSARRPEPRPEFVQAMATRVGESRKSTRNPRPAFAIALTAFMLAALSSIGGVSYAANAVQKAAKRVVAPTQLVRPKSSAADQYANPKVTICHHTGSKKNPTQTITVSESAVPAHLKHGDTIGPCGGVAGASKTIQHGSGADVGGVLGATQTRGTLPFTGSALWIAFLFGIGLLATGVGLRRVRNVS